MQPAVSIRLFLTLHIPHLSFFCDLLPSKLLTRARRRHRGIDLIRPDFIIRGRGR